MRLLIGLFGLLLLLAVLRDAFETVILPRRVKRPFQLTSLFYRAFWRAWRGMASRLSRGIREQVMSWFGPASLLVLLALWALTIILAFGIMHWGAGSALKVDGGAPGFLDDLYLSGTTFFTLGLGDVVPKVALSKVLTVVEGGLGFAFLAVVIGYLPVINQAFSRREISISLLDARAGSPPTAGDLLFRIGRDGEREDLTRLLAEWEHWSAEVLESHLSYSVLAYFRSQHGNQSWLAALTTVLDTSAILVVESGGRCARQAQLTFAMARHAAVDLAQIFSAQRPKEAADRLGDTEFAALTAQLDRAGMTLEKDGGRARLAAFRAMYEPYVSALSRHLMLPLPAWTRQSDRPDNWQAAPWKPDPAGADAPEHF
jgi:hypothetical protein